MSLKIKFFIAFFIISFIPGTLLTVVTFTKTEAEVVRLVNRELSDIAKIQESRTNEALDRYIEKAELITSSTQLRNLVGEYNRSTQETHYQNIKKILEDAKNSVETINTISVLDLDKKIIASTDPSPNISGQSRDDYFDVGAKNHTLVNVYKDRNNILQVIIVGPIVQGGELVGVIEIVADMDLFTAITDDYTFLGETGEVLLAKKNTNGDALFLTPLRFDAGAALNRAITSSIELPVNHALEKGEGILLSDDVVDYRGVSVFAATRLIESLDWGLVIKIDKEEALKPVTDLKKVYLVVVAITLGLIILLSSLFVNTIMRKIKVLIDFSNKLRKGNFNIRAKLNSNDEVGQLAQTMNSMAGRLGNTYKDMDKKIHARTAELEKQNKELEESKKSILNILEDVEREKSVSHDLSKDLEKFHLAVENTSDIVLITDPDGIVIYANPITEKITGYSVKEVVGKRAGVLWGGLMSDDLHKDMWKTLKNKKPFRARVDIRRKDRREMVVDTNIVSVPDRNGDIKFYVDIQRDVTKEAMIDKAKTEFVSLASHQLRTPLTAVKWYAEMLLGGDVGNVTKQQKKYLDEIYAGNERMVELVNSLLNVSRLELGTFAVEPKEVDPALILKEEMRPFEPLTDTKRLKVSLNIEKIEVVNTDEKMLRIIFSNLISNAFKYTPEKGSIDISLKTTAKYLVLSVKDTGYGIPEHQKEKLFTKLFRADNVRQLDTTGTGLGLYIIKSIIDNIGGKVSFQSKENVGTTFDVMIPKKIKKS
jgi:PAS domain S-box-containing protein